MNRHDHDDSIGCIPMLLWIAYMIVSFRFLLRFIGNFIVHVAYDTDRIGTLYIVNKQGLLSNGQYLSGHLKAFIFMVIFLTWAALGALIYMLISELRMRWAFRRWWRRSGT
jgi:hypothetical protein